MPKENKLLSKGTYNKSIRQKEKHQYICWYSEDVHRTMCLALTVDNKDS